MLLRFMNKITNIFISTIYLFCVQATFLFCRKTKLPYCIILTYHSIPDGEIDRFKKQMQILKRFTTPIPINYDGPFHSGTRYSILTFDDARKSVIRNALPEMRKLEVPFTLFIPTRYLSTNPGCNGDNEEGDTTSSIEELSALPTDIVTFGSHTVNHFDLTRVDYEKACQEIEGSKTMLESQFKREIKYFAFPYGSYNHKLVECCHKAGYQQIFSLIPESPLAPLKKYLKGRVLVGTSNGKIEFMLKILGGYGWKGFAKTMRDGLRS